MRTIKFSFFHGKYLFGEILGATLFAIRFAHATGDTLCPTKWIGATI
jgi:hypothetical protein